MTRGILLVDTLARADCSLLAGLDFVCMEPGLVEKALRDPRLAGTELIPMVSSFLGAKTLASKRSELDYAASLGCHRALCYLDSSSLKGGRQGDFAAEVDQLRRWSPRLEPLVFLPCSHFSEAQLRFAARCLVDSGLPVMLYVDRFAEVLAEPFARLAAAFEKGGAYAVFPDRPGPEEEASLPGQPALLGWAHYG